MSQLCDPRNRPGYQLGDPTDLVVELPAPPGAPDELRTVLLVWFSTALIVALVAALVLITG